MNSNNRPDHYESLRKRFPSVLEATENLGAVVREEGPFEKKIGHLIQLAAAAVSNSEGAVHSHTRRALEEGATKDEIYHALLLLVTTVGFPKVAAAISWADDVILKE